MKHKIKDEELTKVVGGGCRENQGIDEERLGTFHTGCGGKLTNIGDFFSNSVCAKCGEKHHLKRRFEWYEIIRVIQTNVYYKKYKDGHREDVPSYPEEIYWSCNQF